jgi:ketosteroid isomerase-like protein
MSKANLELARQGYEALKRGDLEELAAMLDEDVKWHAGDPTAEGACRNKQQALAWLQRAGRGEPPEIVEMVDAGDSVVVILQPAPVEGQEVPPRAQITTFRDGKVVEMVAYPSVEAALAAAEVDERR